MTACKDCGRSIEGPEILYSSDGETLCQKCEGARELAGLDLQPKQLTMAWVALVLAVIAFVFDPHFLVSVAAVVLGIATLLSTPHQPGEAMSAARRRSRIRLLSATAIGLVVADFLVPLVLVLVANVFR